MTGGPWRQKIDAVKRNLLAVGLPTIALLLVLREGWPPSTSANGDVSGEWYLVLRHPDVPDYTGRCLAFVIQNGTGLNARFVCGNEYDLRPESFAKMTGSVQDQQKVFTLMQDLGLGDLFQFTITISQDGTAGSGTWTSPHVTGPGTIVAARTTERWGDADCSGAVDSVDALLLLQRIARVVSSLDCGGFGDANVDGDLDARDAALILQREAGLIPRLPVL